MIETKLFSPIPVSMFNDFIKWFRELVPARDYSCEFDLWIAREVETKLGTITVFIN